MAQYLVWVGFSARELGFHSREDLVQTWTFSLFSGDRLVAKSAPVRGTLDPDWPELEIDDWTLTKCDYTSPLTIVCHSNDQVVGRCVTSLRGITTSFQNSSPLEFRSEDGLHSGLLVVRSLRMNPAAGRKGAVPLPLPVKETELVSPGAKYIITLLLAVSDLRKDGLLKPDPYLSICRLGADGVNREIVKTEVMKRKTKTSWKQIHIDDVALCDSNHALPLQITCFDHKIAVSSVAIGSVTTTLEILLRCFQRRQPLPFELGSGNLEVLFIDFTSLGVDVKNGGLEGIDGGYDSVEGRRGGGGELGGSGGDRGEENGRDHTGGESAMQRRAELLQFHNRLRASGLSVPSPHFTIVFQISVRGIPKQEGLWGVDPYMCVSRARADGKHIEIIRTEICYGSRDPDWKPVNTEDASLCAGSRRMPFVFSLHNHSRAHNLGVRNTLIGTCTSTLEGLVRLFRERSTAEVWGPDGKSDAQKVVGILHVRGIVVEKIDKSGNFDSENLNFQSPDLAGEGNLVSHSDTRNRDSGETALSPMRNVSADFHEFPSPPPPPLSPSPLQFSTSIAPVTPLSKYGSPRRAPTTSFSPHSTYSISLALTGRQTPPLYPSRIAIVNSATKTVICETAKGPPATFIEWDSILTDEYTMCLSNDQMPVGFVWEIQMESGVWRAVDSVSVTLEALGVAARDGGVIVFESGARSVEVSELRLTPRVQHLLLPSQAQRDAPTPRIFPSPPSPLLVSRSPQTHGAYESYAVERAGSSAVSAHSPHRHTPLPPASPSYLLPLANQVFRAHGGLEGSPAGYGAHALSTELAILREKEKSETLQRQTIELQNKIRDLRTKETHKERTSSAGVTDELEKLRRRIERLESDREDLRRRNEFLADENSHLRTHQEIHLTATGTPARLSPVAIEENNLKLWQGELNSWTSDLRRREILLRNSPQSDPSVVLYTHEN